ncbi:nucleotidyltransferase [Flavobacterium sp. ARAG 55.4]|uniref:nucleotidyltransferase n=1 Tax=Flavobacterium sp. ARAG 55.4 TaxID=3451357 RepID=UPI003F44F59B
MARTIQAIQQEIFTRIGADENLVELNSTSKTALYRLFVFVVSFSIWVLEMLFDTHKKEVEDIIEQKMPHRPSWYRTKAKAFQYGFDLIEDSDKYDNTGFTDEEIQASKIITYSAVTPNAGQLLIKIASENGGVLAPITDSQKAAFDTYIKEIADCGVKYLVINTQPDILILTLQIFYDALVLDENGMSRLNGNYPVQEAILQYMKELPFNGELVLAHLVDKLQLVEGVKIPNIINAETQIYDKGSESYLPAQPITVKTVPESGYFTVPNFDNVTYVV